VTENNWKKETLKQWNNKACGSHETDEINLDYFLEVERFRYSNYGPWMKEFYKYDEHSNIKLLEVGFGQGTDLVQYAKGGAEVYGIDITPNHKELAEQNFALRGLKAQLFLEDASEMHFKDNSFDKVVSFGVLHHTPDIQDCVREVHRVLRPNGEFVISLYHRNSIFFLWLKLIVDGIFHLNLFKLGYNGIKATIEKGADGKKIKPLVNLYTTKSLKRLLANFDEVKIEKRHLTKKHFWIFRHLITNAMLKKLEPKFGWYIIAKAKKS
jgi:ubiquinone/menaquinone biosynthesis C-methylase UbiE